ncbi:pepsin/retropepsin-like aspartic protease family protein [Tellurirhabdus bombi]|uniref:pepsin/retropepsin-like aspartic protease family protein n=1 Tax=Tellurirhabdus bombi TaxID=2907205 RepID=UPI001F1D7E34|nr:aspartyl protease family protein [Tellurirhabdus bombi]
MKRFGFFFVLLLCCLNVFGAEDKDDGKDRYGYHLIQNRKIARIPFELHSNLIVVPVKINNSDTLHFILDTGVSSTIITDPAAIRSQKLQFTRKVKLTGAGEGGQLLASVAINNVLTMGHMRANHQNMVVLDEDVLQLSEYVGIPIHGIFGYEVFNNFIVTIDFQRREILLQQPSSYRYRRSRGVRYPIMIQDTKPYTDVLAVVDNGKTVPIRVVIDTGAGHALLINRNNGNEDVRLPDKVIRAQLGRGLSGVINGNLGRIHKIRFGNFEMDNVVASFPDSLAFGVKIGTQTERNGNIGCEILRRFKVTFNYHDKYLVLKPVKRILKQTFEHDMSGMELKARGLNLRNYYIEKIIDDSPADQAGLKEGDEVIFINGSSAAKMHISEIYKLLQKGDGKELEILVRRNGNIIFTQMVLKRLI